MDSCVDGVHSGGQGHKKVGYGRFFSLEWEGGIGGFWGPGTFTLCFVKRRSWGWGGGHTKFFWPAGGALCSLIGLSARVGGGGGGRGSRA